MLDFSRFGAIFVYLSVVLSLNRVWRIDVSFNHRYIEPGATSTSHSRRLSPDSPQSGSNPANDPENALKDPFMFGELNPCGGGDPIPLQKQWLVVGRQPNCDITLRFPNVSSRHCELRLM